ncbi:DMT family transporter [Sporosalibacterium faouarense]|uniref:DMT family transporter n=1 Tax=Sporosalibacterium faouarense TaxID=516123 RepID=UPI00192B153E|nr:DMT family transporter [Sporosalibacterium faouarense]
MEEIKKKGIVADIALLIVAIIWGSGFIATKHGLDSISPLYLNAFRFSLAFILMALVFRKKFKKIDRESIIGGIIIGVFLFLGFGFQTVGLQFTTAGKQAFLTGTNVVMVPFLYWLISKKRPDSFSFIAAILSFIGIGLLTLSNGFKVDLGDSLTIICAFFFACHIVSIGHYAKKSDPITLTILQFGVSAVLSIIVALIFEDIPNGITSQGVFSIIYLGLFSTLIAFLIQNIAQKHTTSTHAAIMLSLESVFGSILSVILLKEVFSINMVIGCAIIFIAIITAETKWKFLIKKFRNI